MLQYTVCSAHWIVHSNALARPKPKGQLSAAGGPVTPSTLLQLLLSLTNTQLCPVEFLIIFFLLFSNSLFYLRFFLLIFIQILPVYAPIQCCSHTQFCPVDFLFNFFAPIFVKMSHLFSWQTFFSCVTTAVFVRPEDFFKTFLPIFSLKLFYFSRLLLSYVRLLPE